MRTPCVVVGFILLLAVEPLAAQIATKTVSVQCNCPGVGFMGHYPPGFDCKSLCGISDVTSVLDTGTSSLSSPTSMPSIPAEAMMMQAGVSLITGLVGVFAERRQRKLEEQRRVEQAIQEEQQRQQQQFEKERSDTLAKMKGVKPGEATLKTMHEFGRERDQALQTAIARVRSNLGLFFDQYDREFERNDSSDCLDGCGASADTSSGQQVDRTCVESCLTGDSGDPSAKAATVLANLGQLDAPELPLPIFSADGVPIYDNLTPKLLRTESLEPMYQNSTWGTSRWAAKIPAGSAFANLRETLHLAAWERLEGAAIDKLAGMIPGGDTLVDFSQKYGQQTVANWAEVLGQLPEAARAAGQLSDVPAAGLTQSAEKIASGYEDTAHQTVVSKTGSVTDPLTRKLDEMKEELGSMFLPRFNFGSGPDFTGEQPLQMATIESRPAHPDAFRNPWKRQQ